MTMPFAAMLCFRKILILFSAGYTDIGGKYDMSALQKLRKAIWHLVRRP